MVSVTMGNEGVSMALGVIERVRNGVRVWWHGGMRGCGERWLIRVRFVLCRVGGVASDFLPIVGLWCWSLLLFFSSLFLSLVFGWSPFK